MSAPALPLSARLVVIAALSCLSHSAFAEWSPNGWRVAVTDSVQSGPVIAPDGSGGAFIVWQDYRSGQSVLHAQHLSSAGIPVSGWPVAGMQVSAGTEYDPVIVADGRGGAFVAASDGRDIGLWHLAAIPPSLGAAITRIDVEKVPGAQPAVPTKSSGTVLPILLPDGDGGVFLAWEEGGHLVEWVYLQHYDASGAPVAPWPAGGISLGFGQNPVLCSDGNDGVIVVYGGGAAKHIGVRADTVVSDWPGGAVPISASSGWKQSFGIVPDHAGGAIVVWQDPRNGSYEQVYAQRLSAAGTFAPGWPDSGIAVCTFPTQAGLTRYSATRRRPQGYSVLVPDGVGGALIAWRDMRADSGDVYLQHLLPDGTIAPGWPTNGLALCTAPGIQTAPSMAPDGAGGAFVSWQDRRSGDRWQAYALHVLASGAPAPGWADGGMPVCAGAGDQLIPRPADDASNRPFFAWQDTRYSASAVFATRLASDGSLPLPSACDIEAAVVTSSADSGTVHIVWHLTPSSDAPVTVYCRQVDGPWMPIAVRSPDLGGMIDYSDRDGIAGCRYGYALGVAPCGGEIRFGEVWIDVPEGAGFMALSAATLEPEAVAGRLNLSWHVLGGERLTAAVFRRDSCSSWTPLATVAIDDSGIARIEDQGLFEGHAVGYRLMVHACWRDQDLAESWVTIPLERGFVSTRAIMTRTEVEADAAHLEWRMESGPPSLARVYRRDSTSAWILRAERNLRSTETIRLDDQSLRPGMRYEYRLSLSSCGVEWTFGPTSLAIPSRPVFELALRGAWPNPGRRGLRIGFTLASSAPARLQLFDAGGRLVMSRLVESASPGTYTLDLGGGTLRPGLYVIRLTQDGRTRQTRATVIG